jgi:hypothetical protein
MLKVQNNNSRPTRVAAPFAGKTMIELYCALTPNGGKISIMLKELGLPYMVIPDNIRAGEPFRPEFLAISPNNRVPAVSSAGLTCDRQVQKNSRSAKRRGATCSASASARARRGVRR